MGRSDASIKLVLMAIEVSFEKLILSHNRRKPFCNQLVAAAMMLCYARQQAHAHDAQGID